MLSGVFSSTEIAIFSLSEIKLRYLVERNVRNAKLLQKLKGDSHKLLITILIGNNLVNIGAAAMATATALSVFPNNGVAVATGVMTFLILIFGEIVPKAFATRYAQQIALFMAPLINVLKNIFYPLVWLFDIITKVFLPKNAEENPLITEEEVRDIVKLSEEEGTIKEQEEQMILNIFKLDDTFASDIMTPRPDILGFKDTKKVREILGEIKKHGFSRIPVYSEDLDTIIGILYAKDLLSVNPEDRIKDLLRPAFFVPETKRIDTLLREFKQKKIHLAIVVNEHSTTVGLVTIEDLIEEIVGEIYDETDTVEHRKKAIREFRKDAFLILGKTELDEVEEVLEIRFIDGDYTTLSGFIMSELNRVPEAKDSFIFKDYKFIVNKVDNQRIEEVEVIKQ